MLAEDLPHPRHVGREGELKGHAVAPGGAVEVGALYAVRHQGAGGLQRGGDGGSAREQRGEGGGEDVARAVEGRRRAPGAWRNSACRSSRSSTTVPISPPRVHAGDGDDARAQGRQALEDALDISAPVRRGAVVLPGEQSGSVMLGVITSAREQRRRKVSRMASSKPA